MKKENHEQEEWGGWKFVSEMLNNPLNGIYPTSKCYQQLYDFVVAQKAKAYKQGSRDNAKMNTLEDEINNVLVDYFSEKDVADNKEVLLEAIMEVIRDYFTDLF